MGEVHRLPLRPRVVPQCEAAVHCHMLSVLVAGYEPGDVQTAVQIMVVAANLYGATIGSDAKASKHLVRVAAAMADLHPQPDPAA